MSAFLTSHIGDQLRPLLRAARRLTTPGKPPGNSFNFLSLMKLPGRLRPTKSRIDVLNHGQTTIINVAVSLSHGGITGWMH